jgi:hypothetical protein
VTRGWKIGIGVGAGIVGLNLVLAVAGSLTGGSPGGPRSSSYATGGDGAAAYADLLAHEGHRVRRLRSTPSANRLDPADTVVVLDPGFVLEADREALATFVREGGRLVAGGPSAQGLVDAVVEGGPEWSPRELHGGRVAAPVAEVAGVTKVDVGPGGVWDDGGSALPAYAGTGGSLLAVARVGGGRAVLLANTTPLHNERIDAADNAQLGVGLAGGRERDVVFLESYHGYGEESGLAAIPDDWLVLFGIAVVAIATLVLARGRRLGPAEPDARELAPPRQAYVEALGGVLARTGGREAAAERVRAEALRLLRARTGLPDDADASRIGAAAASLGFRDDEIAALLGPTKQSGDLLATGRALARLARTATRRSAWRT